MGLKGFHIVFISASSLLAFGFGGWCLHAWRDGQGGGWLAGAAASAAVGLGLIVYGVWFWRKITTRDEDDRRRRKLIRRVRAVPLVLLFWLAESPDALACTVCYGEADGPLIDAARLGVYLLFGLVVVMQVSFATFFVTLWRRARKHKSEE